jgi:hypothetical protein
MPDRRKRIENLKKEGQHESKKSAEHYWASLHFFPQSFLPPQLARFHINRRMPVPFVGSIDKFL